jgi:S1-C subfamily serine protease
MVDVGGAPLSEAEDLQVTLADGKTYRARVIGKSLAYDIAVLRVFAPLKSVKPLPLGSSKNLQVGQSVLAIGNPFGLDHTLTMGIISGLRKEVITDTALQRKIRGAIQTDAAINPGNSGGPLLDSSGRIIGMNTSIKSQTGYSTGVSFAIPVDTLNLVVPLLIARGQLERPELGFSGISNQLAALLGITKGVVVGGVVPDGLAEQAGLRGWKLKEGEKIPTLGDIIVGSRVAPSITRCSSSTSWSWSLQEPCWCSMCCATASASRSPSGRASPTPHQRPRGPRPEATAPGIGHVNRSSSG